MRTLLAAITLFLVALPAAAADCPALLDHEMRKYVIDRDGRVVAAFPSGTKAGGPVPAGGHRVGAVSPQPGPSPAGGHRAGGEGTSHPPATHSIASGRDPSQ